MKNNKTEFEEFTAPVHILHHWAMNKTSFVDVLGYTAHLI